jgi:hypothetical protein
MNAGSDWVSVETGGAASAGRADAANAATGREERRVASAELEEDLRKSRRVVMGGLFQ